jgi:hypothetical protein
MAPTGRCVDSLGPVSKSKKNGLKLKDIPEFNSPKCSRSSLNDRRVPKKLNIEHLVSPWVQDKLVVVCSKLDPQLRSINFRHMIVYLASMVPDQDPNSYVDVVEGAFVTKLFAKRLERRLFPILRSGRAT